MDEEEECECVPGAPAWMATLGDLMSLLLTFFVLMLTFASMEKQLFLKAIGSVKAALGVVEQDPGHFELRSTSVVELSDRRTRPYIDVMELPTSNASSSQVDAAMLAEIQRFLSTQQLSGILDASLGDRGVTIRLKGNVLFEPGSDRLLPQSFLFLDEIVALAREFPYEIAIEGHTDERPIGSPAFPTNWHLSAARAIATLRYLVDVGEIPASRLSATGMSDTRPLVSNETPENRATNRRVEFVFIRDPKRAEAGSRARRRTRE
ncbi:MAG: OmpA family protein [Proteobacteria bacterium]|nr:OmpA family protein [Pseudomonadota bacterium]